MKSVTKSTLAAAAVLVVLLWALPNADAQTYTLDQVLAKMGEVGRSFRSLEASVERTTVDIIVDDKKIEFGKVFFKRAKNAQPQIRFDFTKPAAYTALISEGKARVYNPKLKQVQEYALGKDEDKAEFLLIGFGQSNEQIRQAYNVALVGEESLGGQRVSVLELRPKSERVAAMFASIRLWLDQKQWIPLQTKATESGSRGDYQIVKFTNIQLNGDIKDSVFRLNLPRDVQIVR